MTTPSETELGQRLLLAERKLNAVSDLMVLMAAHFAQVDPERGTALSNQMRELYEMDNVAWTEEFQSLVTDWAGPSMATAWTWNPWIDSVVDPGGQRLAQIGVKAFS